MRIEKIRLVNFRNLIEQEIQLIRDLNLILGQNGQGKTNLIEAIGFALRGETFRYTEADSLIRFGSPFARIEADVRMSDLKNQIKIILERGKKTYFLNDKRTSARQLKKRFPVVLFSPESLADLKESSQYRRSLIDEVLEMTNSRNFDLIEDYNKILKTRNRLLKDRQEPGANYELIDRVLESLRDQFLNLATALTCARIQLLHSLSPMLSQYMLKISSVTSMEIKIEYLISGIVAPHTDPSSIRQLMSARMEKLESAERSLGATLVGPHKHEIRFLLNGNDSRYYASQGQQRALIIAFKLAQIVYHNSLTGDYPILLLDDVLSELDEGKREALISFLLKMDAQILVTSTELGLSGAFSQFDSEISWIRNGRLVRNLENIQVVLEQEEDRKENNAISTTEQVNLNN